MQALASKVGFEEMIEWKMLDDKGEIQQTVFSEGTNIQVDFKSFTYTIDGKIFQVPQKLSP